MLSVLQKFSPATPKWMEMECSSGDFVGVMTGGGGTAVTGATGTTGATGRATGRRIGWSISAQLWHSGRWLQ